MKANVNAAIFGTQGRIGVGCVIRDSSGNIVMVRSTNIMGAYPIREAEALSLKEVLSWLKLKKVNNCIVETNSLLVIEALNNTYNRSPFHLITNDYKHLI